MDIQNILEQYGLSAKEAKIYLSAISLGTASITAIAKKAGLKRPTTYLVIDELLTKHLLMAIPQGKNTFYKTENPQMLANQLEEKKQRIITALPELSTLYHKSSKQPRVRFYEGKDKLYKMYEEIFRTKEIWAMVSIDKFQRIFTEEDNEHFFRILLKQGGIIYDILEDSKKARLTSEARWRKGLTEIKFLPKDFKLTTDILIFGPKAALISFENIMGVIIEDEQIAQTQRKLLQFLWDHL